MNPKTFLEYKAFLDGLSLSEFEDLRSRVLFSLVYQSSLSSDDVVCPLAEDVREKEFCLSCPLKSFCPNFA